MLKYRPDIDGLRAIAVVSVVIYHLKASMLPGGFVGVDIFFVISGYLITKLIHTELTDTGSFSFKRFYIRRVRRLFPALIVTLVLSTALAYWLFSPSHLVEFAESLIASILSLSNVYFWSLTDYFDSESAFKPLLHTWSLSVEEQFYLLWPAVLFFLFTRDKHRSIPLFIVVMAVASLLLNLLIFAERESFEAWFAARDTGISASTQSTAFYWLPFRVFEFAIGAVLVWVGSIQRRYFAEAVFIAGLAMVICSFLLLDDKTDFPSVAALLPCVGAALMIQSGQHHRLNWIVANRLMVGVGLVSYSLYLIHWPLIVFYKYAIGREFSYLEITALAMASLVVAALMYWFVEQPFRRARRHQPSHIARPNRRFLFGAAISALATCSIAVNAITSEGWLWRYPADRIAQLSYKKGDYTEFFWANIKRLEDGFDPDDRPKVLIIGDSMAADLVNVLVAGDAEQQIDLATIAINHNCKSLFGMSDQVYQHIYRGAAPKCQREHTRILAQDSVIKEADTLVLASYLWEVNQAERIPETVAFLQTITDANIMVLGLKVQINDGIQFLSQHAFSPQAHTLRTPLHPRVRQINNILSNSGGRYAYFDLLDGFCNAQGCQRITKDGYAIIFDGSHLSENGAAFLSRSMRDSAWFKTLLSVDDG